MFKTIVEGLYTDLLIKINRLTRAGIPQNAVQILETAGKNRVWWQLAVRDDYYEQAMRELGLLVGEEQP